MSRNGIRLGAVVLACALHSLALHSVVMTAEGSPPRPGIPIPLLKTLPDVQPAPGSNSFRLAATAVKQNAAEIVERIGADSPMAVPECFKARPSKPTGLDGRNGVGDKHHNRWRRTIGGARRA